MEIRPETPSDETAIDRVVDCAFASKSHTGHAEAAIVRALRTGGDLSFSLVAELGSALVGHIAFSPVDIDHQQGDWFGLGPLAVQPAHQRQGIGSALVNRGLTDLRMKGAAGCVVLGDPGFYGRLGFESDGTLSYGGLPTHYIQRIVFTGKAPAGEIRYAPAFDLAG
ncbi:GNAT family N-acetyltransferase [Methyloceanibacter caenitepidi]|uniref:Acetyltransferase n=1 Tax=Methyloceanibacter caenitepidi TaxID=1384459 RepID=A0A0A8K3Q3_9HYPH|nr:N-acetyltransferase [Methyloceanibacter caenitepidi]BAQ17381.1 acetyltransferase [Methyloceanibacter caenitepidi]